MVKTIEAIYENGVFKPISPLPDISEHKKVTLVIEDNHEESRNILSLAAKVYDGLSQKDIEDIEKPALTETTFYIFDLVTDCIYGLCWVHFV